MGASFYRSSGRRKVSSMSMPFRFAGSMALTFTLLGCSGGPGSSEVNGSGANSSSGGSSGLMLTMLGGTNGMGVGGNGASGDSPANQVITQLPAGYTQTDIGGYLLGAAIVAGAGAPGMSSGGAGGAMSGNCGNILLGVSRDFKGADEPMGHPDFNAAISGGDVTPNLVSTTLGTDQKPVYTSQCEIGNPMPAPTCPFGAQTTSQANFDQWYHD